MISYPRDFIFARSLLLILSIISDTCRRRHGERGITRAKSSRVSAGERVHQPGRFGDAPTAGLTCRKHTSALARAIRGQRLPKYLSSDHDPLTATTAMIANTSRTAARARGLEGRAQRRARVDSVDSASGLRP